MSFSERLQLEFDKRLYNKKRKKLRLSKIMT
jgi:hypothetical protein